MRRPTRPDPEMLMMLGRLAMVGEAAPSLEERKTLLDMLRGRGKETEQAIDEYLLRTTDRLNQHLLATIAAQEKLKSKLDLLASPPYHPGIFMGCETTSRGPAAMVAQGGARRVVLFADEFDRTSLRLGDEVLLSAERNLVMEKSPYRVERGGETAIFERVTLDGRLVLRQHDQELLVNVSGGIDPDELRPGDRVRWERESWLACERLERDQGRRYFLENTPEESFENIGGLDTQIAAIKRAVRLHLDYPGMAEKYKLEHRRGVLLVGPPGTGKTMLVRALARWMGDSSASKRAHFISIKPSELNSVWYSAAEANYREVFRVAREKAEQDAGVPVVMFFDEIDSVGRPRGETHSHIDDRILTAFMAELDGLESRGNVLVVGATNRVDALDPALLRAARLGDLVLEIPRPNREAARAIFSRKLPEEIPFAPTHPGEDLASARESIIEAAVSKLYSAHEDSDLVTLRLRSGGRQVLKFRDLVSGAAIAKISTDARENAFLRDIDSGEGGLRAGDLLGTIEEELNRAARVLTPRNLRNHLPELPHDCDVAAIELIHRPVAQPHRYLRAMPGVH